ncbi:MAG: hypothetical protein AAB665_01615 [Patescibacteria group bacterium]
MFEGFEVGGLGGLKRMERADFFRKRILFIKGVFFNDWSLVFGALIVNSGVVFCLYQIGKRKKWIR